MQKHVFVTIENGKPIMNARCRSCTREFNSYNCDTRVKEEYMYKLRPYSDPEDRMIKKGLKELNVLFGGSILKRTWVMIKYTENTCVGLLD